MKQTVRAGLVAIVIAATATISVGSASALGTTPRYLCNGGSTTTFYGKSTSSMGGTYNANGECGANVKVTYKRAGSGTIYVSSTAWGQTTATVSPGGVLGGTHWPSARLAGQPMYVYS
jgi:hypothetical protein